MIIKQSRISSPNAKSVGALADYLLYGQGAHRMPPYRRCRYLFTNSELGSVSAAAAEMILVNDTSFVKTNKHEHYVFSLCRGEHLSRDEWQRVIGEFRTEFGYQDTLYFAAVHKDRACEHLHLVVSAIDIKRHVKISSWNSYYRAAKLAARLNREFGLQDSWSKGQGNDQGEESRNAS